MLAEVVNAHYELQLLYKLYRGVGWTRCLRASQTEPTMIKGNRYGFGPMKDIKALMFKYYQSVFKDAARHTYAFVNVQGLLVAAIAAILGIVLDLAYQYYSGEMIARHDQIRSVLQSGLIAILILVCGVFVFQLLKAPVSGWATDQETISKLKTENDEINDLKRKLDTANRRVYALVQKLPPPDLTEAQRQSLKLALEKMGPHTVSIEYLDERTSRANVFAWKVTEVFREALWDVELRPVKHVSAREGLGMRVEAVNSLTDDQRAVVEALKQAEILRSLITANVAGRIELEVGEM